MSSLHSHKPRPHIVQNANHVHRTEQDTAGFNDKLAVLITNKFGNIWMFYILVAWMLVWMILATAGIWLFKNDKYPFSFLLFLSNLIQLWALPVLAFGQQVLSRKAEIQADQQFKDVENSYHDIEQIRLHLDAQDQELHKQAQVLTDLVAKIGEGHQELSKQSAMLNVALTPRRRPMKQEAKYE